MKTLARPHCCAIQWAAVEKAPDIGKVFLRVFYSLQKVRTAQGKIATAGLPSQQIVMAR